MNANALDEAEVTKSRGLERRSRSVDRVNARSRAEDVERDGSVCALIVR